MYLLSRCQGEVTKVTKVTKVTMVTMVAKVIITQSGLINRRGIWLLGYIALSPYPQTVKSIARLTPHEDPYGDVY